MTRRFRSPAGRPLALPAWMLCAALAALVAGSAAAAAPPLAKGSMQSSSQAIRHTPNHLIHEKSPYLLQHAYNPVDWRPWGEAAFEKARTENKPIFLSIGYSTCHWCHVMERESFENDSIAALLNRDFVPIKVDREERPDIDRIYMSSMQAMGMGGGWPLNVFLTPDLAPFYGGTYFPPHSIPGRAGMMELLPRVHDAWLTQHAQLVETSARVFTALAASARPAAGDVARDALFPACAEALSIACDMEHGGFGGAPKFPSIVNLDFLWRWWAVDPAGHARAREMAELQLDAMRAGGIHDHLGGGFHRYSTDAAWRVPHFEKMLYDQAQLANAYIDGALATGRPEYAAAAREVFTYVERDLSAPGGGFDSAEDADSEGEEGRFYVWTPQQIEAVLGADEARAFCAAYGVSAHGNFENGTNILHQPLRDPHHSPAKDAFVAARAKLLAQRSLRVRPHLDDKVLAAWNGLMIGAFARGSRAFDDPALAERARLAAEFVWTHLRDPETHALHRRWRDGEAAGLGQLDDYADVALGFLELYQATFDPRWLERSADVTQVMIERFYDHADGGFFESPAGDASIKLRLKDEFDGAEIAGNSIAAEVLERLAVLLDRPAWRALAKRTFDDYARRLRRSPTAMPRMIAAMLLERSTPRHIVIAGDPAAAETRAMIREFDRRFLPNDVLIVTTPGTRATALRKLVPFAADLPQQHGRATAYVCVNYACQLPTTDAAAFAAQLDHSGATARKEP